MAKAKNISKRVGQPRAFSDTALARWMDHPDCKLSTAQIAAKLGVAAVTVLNYRRGVFKPGRRVATELERLSNGAVSAASWDEPWRPRVRRR